MKKFFLFAILAIFLAACDSPTPEGISVDPEVINADFEGGKYTVNLTCGGQWTAKANKKWVKVSPSEGTGNAEITLKVDENEDNEEETAKVTFTSGENTAVVKVMRGVKGLTSVSPESIDAPAEGGEYTIEVTASGVTWKASSDVDWFTFSPESGEGNGEITVVISKNRTWEESSAVLTIEETGEDADPEHKFEVTITRAPREGEKTTFIFSVSETQVVKFSPANLQYQPSTKTFRFAPNQLDCIGADNAKFTDATYEGWMDLFGWGTGDNPTNNSNDYMNYQTFTDWGINEILNNGKTDPANTWRTLTEKEWTYIVSSRQDASKLRAKATVNGVKGVIVLPDDWSNLEEINLTDGDFGDNVISLDVWNKAEKQGAVFLTTGGMRRDGIEYVGRSAIYWSATTSYLEKYAYCFTAAVMGTSFGDMYRNIGCAVRLVKDVE